MPCTPRPRPAQALAAALLALLGAAAAGPAQAQVAPERATAAVRVVVEVPRVMRMHLLAQPPGVQVTADDVARGYVDTRYEMRMAVDSNSREGYSLMVVNHGTFLAHAEVSGLGTDLQLRPGAMTVSRPAAGRGLHRDVLLLGVRIALAAGAQPGVYPWPIQLAAVNP